MDNLSKSAFSSYLQALDTMAGDGVIVGEWTMMGIAAVMAQPGRCDAAGKQLTDFAAMRGAIILNQGPAQWLLIAKQTNDDWQEELAAALDGTAAHFDQSSGYGLLTLSGNTALKLLQKGLFVDLGKALTFDGASVASVIGHVPVIVLRTAPDAFIVAVPRSFAGSFWHWLEAAAAAEPIKLGRSH